MITHELCPAKTTAAVSLEEGLRHLIDASKAVLSILDPDLLLEVLMERAIRLTRAERAFLLLDDGSGRLVFRTGQRADGALLGEEDAVMSRSVAEEVFRGASPVLSSNALGEEAFRSRKSVLDLRILSVMCAPLLVQRRPIGVLYVDSSQVRSVFNSTSLAVFQMLADLAAIALENARLYALATTDSKTGLANAGLFHARVESTLELAKRQGGSLGVVLVDLDHFKAINDTYGHPAGDRVLAGVAEILRQSVRGDDLAARYGGEEFALVLRRAPQRRLDVSAIAERVRAAIEERCFELPGQGEIRVTASLGVARFPAAGIEVADDLIAVADSRLYAAKRAGRNRVVE